jgi:hypothetical protein
VNIKDINLEEKLKDEKDVTLQHKGEELWRWMSIEDVNLKERLLCKTKEKGYGDG